MQFIKKQLQHKLSVSAKLSLRSAFARAKATAFFLSRLPGYFLRSDAATAPGRRLAVPQNLRSPLTPAPGTKVSDEVLSSLLSESKLQLLARRAITSSIIIPVFNKAEFTSHCLRSLLKEIDLSVTEVIVVDNASTDETASVLNKFGDLIQVVANEENRGFVDACNQGAAVARGQFLVFLNNDTEVLPGWLKHLEQTALQKPVVGAVGSLLLYPDGSIQEAGAIAWKNGEAHHYGWSASPDDRRFNFAREVDYCSAASLLIRKTLFDQLGGFDRRFAPAYYEDVDLCFGVRSLGYKVWYQPASRLVHYEGITAGTDVKTGIKQFQVINRERFVQKWQAVLERDHFKKDVKRVREAAHRLAGQTILVFDERVPSPDRDAGSARMFIILKSLALWSNVVFMAFNRSPERRYEEALWQEGIETSDMIDYRRLVRTRKVMAAIVSRPLLAEALIPRVRRLNPGIAIVFDTVDAHFVRLQREAQLSGNAKLAAEAEKYKRLEIALARRSDAVWVTSEEDKKVFQEAGGELRIDIVPTIHALHDRGRSFAERNGILFVGNMAHRPNSDGVIFFIEEVLPRIRESFPEIKVFIVGDNAPPQIQSYNSEQVVVTGFLADTSALFHECRVFIAPVRFGAGIRGKLGEAMSYGLPAVTTSIGGEGFDLVNCVNAMIADTPSEFAGAVLRLYREKELWQIVSDNAYRRIGENFTPEVIAKTINRSLSSSKAAAAGSV